MKKPFHFLTATICTVVCCKALAHDSWLAPDDRQVKSGSELRMGMTSGEHFPVAGTGIAPDRVDKASCLQGGAAVPLVAGEKTVKFLRLVARPKSAEGIVCWVELKPRNFDLAASKIAGYLDEIDAPAPVRAAWDASPAPKKWNETYTKNAKVVVPGTASAGQTAVATPVGLTLEFVAQVDLSSGHVEGKLPVLLLLAGKPAAGLSVALGGEKGKPVRQRTDAQGRVEFAAPGPGRWMLSATDLRPIERGTGKWESQFATLVFEILPASR